MKHINTAKSATLFKVLHATAKAEAAMMTLRRGQSSSKKIENEHPRCEQWLFVVRGSGKAAVGKRSITLKTNSLLVIEPGEPHRITNTGKSQLVTLNFYVPPAYTKTGDVKAVAKIPRLRTMIGLK
jgi:mannose-6-phosphate isomerase-like protein (cupin superfamily)